MRLNNTALEMGSREREENELRLTFYIFKKSDLLEISLCTFKILIKALAVSRQRELLSHVTFH